jgi:hypothetical protein
MHTSFLATAAVLTILAGSAACAKEPPAAGPVEGSEPSQNAGERPASEQVPSGISPRSKQPRRVPQTAEARVDIPATNVELPAQLRASVIADAARRAGVSESAVVVRGSEEIQFPDGSLGCPQPGMMYTQMVIPGYRVVVQAGGKTFDYRATRDGEPGICVPRVGELVPRPVPRDANR